LITAVDTNVLLDAFGADTAFGERSAETLRRCMQEGQLVACDVVWTETGSFFDGAASAQNAMATLGVEFGAIDEEVALAAASAWRSYRRKGGTRTRVAASFLIGAHAGSRADRLLTRDRGFYRSYFRGVEIIDPSR
jgi:hypothetical protein